jgi:hypothetical protein
MTVKVCGRPPQSDFDLVEHARTGKNEYAVSIEESIEAVEELQAVRKFHMF